MNELGTSPALCPLIRILFAVHYPPPLVLAFNPQRPGHGRKELSDFMGEDAFGRKNCSPFIWSLTSDKEFQSSSLPLLPLHPSEAVSSVLPTPSQGLRYLSQALQLCAPFFKYLWSLGLSLLPLPITLRLCSFFPAISFLYPSISVTLYLFTPSDAFQTWGKLPIRACWRWSWKVIEIFIGPG